MATGVGMGFDLDALDKAIVKADRNLQKLAQDAELQSQRISQAFSLGATKGISQFVQEISNARGGISKLMKEGAEFKFSANGAKGFSSKIIDEINKVVNYSRQEFEALNANITKSMLIKPTLDVNSIKELENRLNILNQGLATGMLGQGRGKKKIAVDNDLRVRINDEIKAIHERLSVLRMSSSQFNQMKAQEAASIIKNVQLEREAGEQAILRGRKVVDAYNAELKAAQKAYSERLQMYKNLFNEQARLESSNRRGAYQNAMLGGKGGMLSADSALKYTDRIYSDKGLKSLNNMNLAIQKMQQAQQSLNLKTDEGKKKYEELGRRINQVRDDINKVTGASEELNKKHKGLLDTSGQLARAFAAVFSVSAIRGYVNKLMQIRGEFELQQRSLQVLLQNKDEANALWDKTVALAVKSPYTTKQLVTATKQLAAYRVESEKLYETNKMLADVSIGLGVDMNRLILAFGQVKAANFLRGTELRQFSEAGVNMLDELAKRFTALEGRAVSVGEVFERVSKRMVSFKDVEAVFKTVTSEGGTFYQMQEKQSETLKGMMLNLKDSYELALNDIGKSNEGMLKSFVSFMRIFVDGWREAAVVIKTAGAAMLFYFAASKIAKIGSAFSGLWAAMAANPVGAIAAGVGVLIGLFVSLYQHTNKLNEALLEVEKNVGESLEESIGLYRKLTDTINDSTKSLDERNKAYEELKTKFKDILPDQQLELEYIQDLKFSYKEAEDAMFAYYNAKAIQQKKDKIESIYEGDFDRDTKDIITKYKDIIENTKKLNEEQKVLLKSGVGGAVLKTLEKLKKGEINIGDAYGSADAAAMAVENSIEEFLKDYSGIEINVINGIITKNAKELARTAKKYTDAMLDVEGLSFETAAQKEAYNAMQEHNKEMENAVSLYKHLVSLRQKLADNKVDLTSDKSTLNEKQLQDREWYLNDLNNTLNEINKLSPDVAKGINEIDKSLVSAAKEGSYEFAKSLGVAENALYNIFADKAKTLKGRNEGASAMLTNFAEGIKANAESKLATPLQQAIINAFDLAIKERDIDQKGKDLLAKLLPDSKQTTEDVRKSVEALLKQYQDEVKKWENATAAGATKLPFVEYLNQFGNTEFKSAISQYLGSTEDFKNLEQKMIPVLEHIYRLLGGEPKKDKTKKENLLEERLRVIKELHKAYKELIKDFEHEAAVEGAWDKFGDAFIKAYEGTHLLPQGYETMSVDQIAQILGYPTEQGMINFYNELIKLAKDKEEELKVALASGEITWELSVEKKQGSDKAIIDEIERMFGNYEVTLEMDKLDIPVDFAEQIFDFKSVSLDELRKKIQDEITKIEQGGGETDQLKRLKDFLQRVDKIEDDRLKDRAKEYVKYLRQEQDERIKIKLEEARKLKEIEETKEFTPIQKETMKANVRQETKEKLSKAEWDAFTKTPYVVQMFDDLDNVSTKALEGLHDKLQTLKDDLYNAGLPASELKEILDKINKVEEELNERQPYRSFGEGLKNAFGGLAKARKEYESQLLLQKSFDENYKRVLSEYNDFIEKNGEFGGNEKVQLEREQLNSRLLVAKKNADEFAKKAQEAADNLTKAQKSVINLSNGLADSVGYMQDLTSSAIELADSFGAFSSAEEKAVADGITNILGSIGGIAQAGAQIATGNVLGGIVSAATSIIGLITNINKLHDAKLDVVIQKEAKSVELLQKKYEELEEQMDRVYSVDRINEYYNASLENIDQQIAATQKMREAEEDKKKIDADAVRGYDDEIDELLKKRDEAESEYLQKLGGVGGEANYGDIISGFVDAWLDGFLEVGDGIDSLNEHFDDFIKNIISKQLAARVVSARLQGVLTHIDNSIANDGIFDKDEWETLLKHKEDVLPQLNEALTKILEEFGASDWAGKDSELGSLSGGISNISEETADVLAGYLNSIRFFVADSNTQLKLLVELQTALSNNTASEMSKAASRNGIWSNDEDTANPMLPQLRMIAAQTTAINELLQGLVRGGHTMGGTGLKVFIN